MKLSKEDRIEIEKLLIHQELLHAMQDYMDKEKLSQNDLAKILGVSKSYISQLFHGNKVLNLEKIAQFSIEMDLKLKTKFCDREVERSKLKWQRFHMKSESLTSSIIEKSNFKPIIYQLEQHG